MDLSGLLDILHTLPEYRRLLEGITRGEAHREQPLGLIRSARPFVAAALARDIAPQTGDRDRPVLIITARADRVDRKSTRLNSSHVKISYAVFCLKKKNTYL